MRLVVLLLTLTLSSSSFAQSADSTAPEKDPAIAVLLSVGGTFASYAAVSVLATGDNSDAGAFIGAGALLVGPSLGQWYAGRVGGPGIAARAAGALAVIWGIGHLDTHVDEPTAKDKRDQQNGQIAIVGGLALWIGSTIYDWVAARNAARSWNREHAVSVSPTLLGATRTPGVAMSLEF